MFFEKYGLHIAGIVHLDPKEACDLAKNGVTIVDVRDEMEMNGKKFIVPNVIYLPTKQLAQEFASLHKERPLILADSVGLKSKEAILFLLAKGFTDPRIAMPLGLLRRCRSSNDKSLTRSLRAKRSNPASEMSLKTSSRFLGPTLPT